MVREEGRAQDILETTTVDERSGQLRYDMALGCGQEPHRATTLRNIDTEQRIWETTTLDMALVGEGDGGRRGGEREEGRGQDILQTTTMHMSLVGRGGGGGRGRALDRTS